MKTLKVKKGTYGSSKRKCIWFINGETKTFEYLFLTELTPNLLLDHLLAFQNQGFQIKIEQEN